ncbi:DegT/DnrJ/EryC1/StrS family aminotransferase [Pseudomonas protegens]|uniref:DegT/DnrJ/EryC1/StrS family aminotransferase n=1 Tax=Pseudomonas protegens TaxID=380021 RepID=UPI002264859F|nr:DegT/DnrJ/EryC1/StrS family aminotransferase [Pseudomonas protegens]
MIKLSQPNISEFAINSVAEVLRSGKLVHGEESEAFEQELAAYIGCNNAILVSSGTAALHIALMALDIGPGDAVIVPDFTFPATANVVAMVGARAIIVDVNLDNYTLSIKHLEETIQNWKGPERLRAIMPVHEFGCPADMNAIKNIAKNSNLFIVEDAACALGATFKDKKTGTLGDIGCFSFHPRKTLTTGEGGLLTTNNSDLATRIRRLRNHGMERGPEGMSFIEPATNYRLTNFQAALGRAQLPELDGWIEIRKKLAQHYLLKLRPLEEKKLIKLPTPADGHSWQTFMLVLKNNIDRASVINNLKSKNIESNLGAQSLTEIGIYGVMDNECPNGKELFHNGLALPFFEGLNEENVDYIVEALEACLTQYS